MININSGLFSAGLKIQKYIPIIKNLYTLLSVADAISWSWGKFGGSHLPGLLADLEAAIRRDKSPL